MGQAGENFTQRIKILTFKSIAMIKNYFKIAWRNLWKNKTFSFINILGLASGLACFLLIALFVMDELSYDRFYKKADRIYRVNSDIVFGGAVLHFTTTPDMMGQLLQKDYPQVEDYARLYTNEGSQMVKKGNEFITEENAAFADSTFFNVFDFAVVEGELKTALHGPNTIVINETTAKKYFSGQSAVGKTLEFKTDGGTAPYKVTAVIRDIPRNSHMNLSMLMSMKNVDYNWGQITSHNFHTYLLLKEGTDHKVFEKNFTAYINKYVLPSIQANMNVSSMSELEKQGNSLKYSLMPLTSIHLYSDYNHEITPPGSIKYVYIFAAVALFILLIACMNFINLSTAKSARRAKEVGIRKTLGTERKTLIAQFLFESGFTAFLAMLIAIIIAWLVMPLFNSVSGKEIVMMDLLTGRMLAIILLLPLVAGLLAGSYPAIYLSSFNPVAVLKSSSGALVKKSSLRSALVVFQFASSILLITGTLVVYRQLNYIQNAKLGFNKDQVLVINSVYALGNNASVFKDAVLGMSGVSSGTLSSYLPVSSSSRSDNTYSKEAVMNAKNGIDMQTWNIDHDYIKTMGMEIIRGRGFSKAFADSNAMIVNETTAKFIDEKDPIGKKMYAGGNQYTVIGVVKNFHFESMKHNVGPLCFLLRNSTGYAAFKVNAANVTGLIAQVENKWKTMSAGVPFSYRFLDDSFTEMYHDEQRIGKLALSFSILAILIACLGLFGLAAFTAEQRTKEIGIRKVLGASAASVINMLNKEFIKLVLISSVIAIPLAWWAMNKWLEDFAYRVEIGWWVFVVAGIIALLIAVLTVSSQAIKAAFANPVKSLRSE